MLTYSRWDPSSGRYEYFETNQRPGLNNDMPVPKMPAATDIGVPSTECGRPIPSGARRSGDGEFAEGFIALPAGVDVLSGSGAPSGTQLVGLAAVGGVVVLGALWLGQR